MSPPRETRAFSLAVAARLSAPGRSALATIGVAGPDAISLVTRLFKPADAKRPLAPGSPRYGPFGSSAVDDVVIDAWPNGSPPVVTIHCHGGAAIVASIMDDLAREGAQLVSASEFLQASGHGATRAQAAIALSRAPSAKTAAILLDQLNGALEEAFARIESGDSALARRLLEWAEFGRHLSAPWKVLLFGRANVGKSQLLNAIAGFERAIVADQPGTTRDLVTVNVVLEGWPFELADGAGFHEAPGDLEREGQDSLRAYAAEADLRVQVLDLSEPLREFDESLTRELGPHLLVGAKSDLPAHPATLERVGHTLSSKTRQGVDRLIQLIVASVVRRIPKPGEAIPFEECHVSWLERECSINLSHDANENCGLP